MVLALVAAVAEDTSRGGSPHDTLFHLAFSEPEVARAELLALLPPQVSARLELDALTQVTNRTVSTRLRSLFTDVLYRVPVRGDDEVFVWFLLEHQSTADRLMPFRVLQYEVDRWATHLRSRAGRRSGRLPMVVPVVILHDPAGRRLPARLSELYEGPRDLVALLAPLLPDFAYLVDDLPSLAEDDIESRSASAVYRLALWLLRSRGEGAADRFEAYREAFARLADEEKWAFADAFLVYAMRTSSEVEPVVLRAARAASPKLTEGVMGIWQQKIDEGRAEGVAQGREQGLEQGREQGLEQGLHHGRVAMLLEQLAGRFGPVPTDVAQHVQAGSAEELRRWGLRLLTARTLAGVFEDA
ncbi:MAG: Rpn family recombination-promoting nuclease/putative transposase [Myxococcales bacterium]|nr:Rpn family recombination-promoting nuclease/putative transposase [Myxococcales bacterium]MCB9649010.1 Rpn family recombination-promoting nuclease/putative transposase [Deltaproteobacteria bacterium]